MNSECLGRLRRCLVYSIIWRVDSHPCLYRHCDPDHRRSPVSPILQTFTSRWCPRSYPAGSWILPISIHGNIPSSSYTSGFSWLSVSTSPRAEILCWWWQLQTSGRCCASQWCDAIRRAPSYTVRPVINYNYRLIRHGCVYILQRVTCGIKGYVTGIFFRSNAFRTSRTYRPPRGRNWLQEFNLSKPSILCCVLLNRRSLKGKHNVGNKK